MTIQKNSSNITETFIIETQEDLGGVFVAISGDTMYGTLYVPVLSATTISGDTFYGDGSGLTNISHNNNINLQGGSSGSTGQYYHLTSSEYSNVSADTLSNTYTTILDFTGHTHPVSGVTSLQGILDGKADLTGSTFTGLVSFTGISTDNLTATTLDLTGNIINSLTNDVLINNNLKVTGDVILSGSAITTNTDQLLIRNNILSINYNDSGDTVTRGSAGIEIGRGTGDTYNLLFIESADTFNIGFINKLQPVATREELPLDHGVAIWDNSTNKFNTTTNLSLSSITASTIYGNGSNITGLDEKYVNLSGDTINGNLITKALSAETLNISNLSGSTDRVVKVDQYGTLLASDDKKIISNITSATAVDTFQDTICDGAVWDYVIKSSSGMRAGTVTAVWSGLTDNIEYYEISTNDIGITTNVSLKVDILSDNVRLLVTPTSGSWTIKFNKTLL